MEGLERCLAAFAAYDPRRRGVIKRADFARALKNTLDVTLTERQSVAVAEDCRADAPATSAGFARIDYCHFLRACFPSESRALGVMSAEDRAASRIQRGVTARFTELDGSTDAGLDTSRDDTFIREEEETTFDDATRISENVDPRAFPARRTIRFTAPSRACATWASRTRPRTPRASARRTGSGNTTRM